MNLGDNVDVVQVTDADEELKTVAEKPKQAIPTKGDTGKTR